MEVGEGKQILLIADIAGYGKVALSAMQPVLSHMGFTPYNLPTALISNTFDYGKFAVLDTTQYMRDTLRIWGELGFRFDAVSTGYIASEEQAALVYDFCMAQKEKGAVIFTDPIMADGGSLYQGLTDVTVSFFRKILPAADYTVPNYTEACLLAGVPYKETPCSGKELREIVDRIRGLGARSIAVTSVFGEQGHLVTGYDAAAGEYFELPYQYIPQHFPGTGDIFASVLMGRVMNGVNFRKATQSAMNVVYDFIQINMGNTDKSKGIQIESSLNVIDRNCRD